MAFLLERDSVNGKDGKGFMIKDGRVTQLFQIKKISAIGTFRESNFEVVGTRIIQKKISGVECTGSMTIYYGTPIFLRMLKDYMDNRDSNSLYFDLQVVNDDKSATVGKQTVRLRNCKFSGDVPVAMLDATSDALETDVRFSFTELEILREFNEPLNYGGKPDSMD